RSTRLRRAFRARLARVASPRGRPGEAGRRQGEGRRGGEPEEDQDRQADGRGDRPLRRRGVAPGGEGQGARGGAGEDADRGPQGGQVRRQGGRVEGQADRVL